MAAKPAGSTVVLRVAYGEVPRAGTVLCMPSGRRYWVFYQSGKSLHCRVMAPGDPIPNIARAVINWYWAGRRKKPDPNRKPIAQLIAEFEASKAHPLVSSKLREQ